MPGFALSARCQAPVEDVWKLLFDPARFPDWWVGIETVRKDAPGEFTQWPSGYPDFPMPQKLRVDQANERVTVSCQVSDIEIVWQLAEALARSGRPDEAAAEVRRVALEPVRSSDQPWALVPRMTQVQGLIALARGDRAEARRRLSEAAEGWRRHLEHDTGAELLANFVDLGRAPIVGLVEPGWELRRLTAELAGLDELTEVS